MKIKKKKNEEKNLFVSLEGYIGHIHKSLPHI